MPDITMFGPSPEYELPEGAADNAAPSSFPEEVASDALAESEEVAEKLGEVYGLSEFIKQKFSDPEASKKYTKIAKDLGDEYQAMIEANELAKGIQEAGKLGIASGKNLRKFIDLAKATADAPLREEILVLENAPLTRTGKIWEVIVIREGLSLNGTYYTREALEDSIPLWEGQEVCFYGWDPSKRGHVPSNVEEAFPEGTYGNNCGFIRGVKGGEYNGRYCLIAEFVCTNEALRNQLLETYEAGGRMPGFSIHAYTNPDNFPVEIREGRKVRVIYEIIRTKELTLVDKPAAGGIATRLIAGQTPNQMEEEPKMDLSKVRAFVAGRLPEKAVAEMTEGSLMESAAFFLKEMDGAKSLVELALKFLSEGKAEEAKAALEMAMGAAGAAPEAAPVEEEPMGEEPMYEGRQRKNEMRGISEPAITEAVQRAEAAEKRLAAFEQRAALREAKATLNEKLTEAKLPEAFAAKVRKQFDGRLFEAAELDAEIADMQKLVPVKESDGDAKIGGQNVPRVQVIAESADKFQAAFDVFMGYKWKQDKSLTEAQKELYRSVDGTRPTKSSRALYEMGSGDYTGTRAGKRGSLTESVNNTTFSNALDTSITRILQFDFSNMPDAKWQNFVKEVPGETLLQRDRTIIGGIGMLPVVAEGGTYQDMSQPKEYTSSYSLEKRGGYYSVTEEAVLNDRIDALRGLPDKIRNAALEAEKTLVYKALIGDLGGGGINTDTSYTGVAHYNAAHGNYSTTALSNAALIAARLMTKRFMVFATETALNDATDINTTDTTVTVDSSAGIRAGMYIRIDSEYMKVTAVSGNDLTVVRAARGTTAAAHLDNAKVFSYSGMLPWEANGGFAMNIIVPTELEDEAFAAVASQFLPGGANNDVNNLYADYAAGRIQIVAEDSIYLGGDTTNWFTAVPWQVAPGLEFGYLDGQRIPQVINQTQDFVDDVFLADTMKIKVKHRIGANNMFHEGRTGHIVSG